VWVATTTGLAWSRDKGKSWRFVRGQDWIAKVQGLYGGPPAGWQPTGSGVLAEDYVNCLAEDPASSKIWVGYRQRGCGLFYSAESSYSSEVSGVYANTILPLGNKTTLVGCYADGLVDAIRNKQVTYKSSSQTAKPTAFVSPPSPAKPPSLAEVNAMLKELASIPAIPEAEQPKVIVLDDDWRTQGDWLGRYGRYWACLAALVAPEDYIWGAGTQRVNYQAFIGPNHPRDDFLRHWIQWLRTDEVRCLEMPPVYLHSRVVQGYTTWEKPRRAALWDDHGESYPMTLDGPHIYCGLEIPAGRFFLSLYNANYNGHGRKERFRDYRVSIKSYDGETGLKDYPGFEKAPRLAGVRIREFHNGVWKRFLVNGPTDITIELNRNYSFNSGLAAVTLDLVDDEPPPYFQTRKNRTNVPPTEGHGSVSAAAQTLSGNEPKPESADQLLRALEHVLVQNPNRWAEARPKHYISLLRWYARRQPRLDRDSWLARLGTCYYLTAQYAKWEECQQQRGLTAARQIEKQLRWDGKTLAYSGRGHQTVTNYLSAHRNNAGGKAQ
jgi:hypothetical protein